MTGGTLAVSPARLLAVNIGLVCVFLAVGMALPANGSRLDLSPGAPVGAGPLVGDFLAILKNNFKLVLMIFCGAFTFGIYPAVVLCANALVLGSDLVVILGTNPSELRYLLPFLPQEFVAFSLAASVSEYFGLRLFRYLFFGEAFGRFCASLWFMFLTVVLIALAAVLETLCKYARNNGVF
jgi:uncharacterized membrane protein SpoIIM required for sporulation